MSVKNRLEKLEEEVKNEANQELPMFWFEFDDKNISDSEIILFLEKKGIKVTKREFRRWRKQIYSNKLIVISPNFEIEKLIEKANNV